MSPASCMAHGYAVEIHGVAFHAALMVGWHALVSPPPQLCPCEGFWDQGIMFLYLSHTQVLIYC